MMMRYAVYDYDEAVIPSVHDIDIYDEEYEMYVMFWLQLLIEMMKSQIQRVAV